jgi:hypothetical protein
MRNFHPGIAIVLAIMWVPLLLYQIAVGATLGKGPKVRRQDQPKDFWFNIVGQAVFILIAMAWASTH